jgi:cell division septum initiation protein DivIVA
MRPTSAELLETIAQELEDRVLPVVQDKWGASTLRSAMQLLRHLALRVPLEPRMLAEDNKDASGVLMLARDRLTRLGESDLAAAAAAALDSDAPDPLDVVAVDALNERYLRAVETIVAARDRLRPIDDSPTIHQSLVDYLQRRLEREHGMFLPVFLSAPF